MVSQNPREVLTDRGVGAGAALELDRGCPRVKDHSGGITGMMEIGGLLDPDRGSRDLGGPMFEGAGPGPRGLVHEV